MPDRRRGPEKGQLSHFFQRPQGPRLGHTPISVEDVGVGEPVDHAIHLQGKIVRFKLLILTHRVIAFMRHVISRRLIA